MHIADSFKTTIIENVPNALLTSREAAQLLSVGVSTLKRWADSGLLSGQRTAGGHRRFAAEEVERLRTRLRPTAAADPTAYWLQRMLDPAGSALGLAGALLEARAVRGSWWAVADDLGLALTELGQRWARAEITVLDEHLAAEQVSRALAWCAQSLPVASSAPTAMLATAEGDDHTLGLSLVELCCREASWSTRWAGRRSPVEELAAAIAAGQVQLVALSASQATTDSALLARTYEPLVKAAERAGVSFVLGGEGAWPEQLVPAELRLHRFADFHRFLVGHPALRRVDPASAARPRRRRGVRSAREAGPADGG